MKIVMTRAETQDKVERVTRRGVVLTTDKGVNISHSPRHVLISQHHCRPQGLCRCLSVRATSIHLVLSCKLSASYLVDTWPSASVFSRKQKRSSFHRFNCRLNNSILSRHKNNNLKFPVHNYTCLLPWATSVIHTLKLTLGTRFCTNNSRLYLIHCD
jgi:hypothetical protein